MEPRARLRSLAAARPAGLASAARLELQRHCQALIEVAEDGRPEQRHFEALAGLLRLGADAREAGIAASAAAPAARSSKRLRTTQEEPSLSLNLMELAEEIEAVVCAFLDTFRAIWNHKHPTLTGLYQLLECSWRNRGRVTVAVLEALGSYHGSSIEYGPQQHDALLETIRRQHPQPQEGVQQDGQQQQRLQISLKAASTMHAHWEWACPDDDDPLVDRQQLMGDITRELIGVLQWPGLGAEQLEQVLQCLEMIAMAAERMDEDNVDPYETTADTICTQLAEAHHVLLPLLASLAERSACSTGSCTIMAGVLLQAWMQQGDSFACPPAMVTRVAEQLAGLELRLDVDEDADDDEDEDEEEEEQQMRLTYIASVLGCCRPCVLQLSSAAAAAASEQEVADTAHVLAALTKARAGRLEVSRRPCIMHYEEEDHPLEWQALFSAADMYVRHYWGQHTGGAAAAAAPAAAMPMPEQVMGFIETLVERAWSTVATDAKQWPQKCRQLLQLGQAALRAGYWQALHRQVHLIMHQWRVIDISTEQLCAGGDGSILALLCSCLRLCLQAAAASEVPHNNSQVAEVCWQYANLLRLVAERGHAAATAARLVQAGIPDLLLRQLRAQPFQPTATMSSCLLKVLPHTCFLISASVHEQPGALESLQQLLAAARQAVRSGRLSRKQAKEMFKPGHGMVTRLWDVAALKLPGSGSYAQLSAAAVGVLGMLQELGLVDGVPDDLASSAELLCSLQQVLSQQLWQQQQQQQQDVACIKACVFFLQEIAMEVPAQRRLMADSATLLHSIAAMLQLLERLRLADPALQLLESFVSSVPPAPSDVWQQVVWGTERVPAYGMQHGSLLQVLLGQLASGQVEDSRRVQVLRVLRQMALKNLAGQLAVAEAGAGVLVQQLAAEDDAVSNEAAETMAVLRQNAEAQRLLAEAGEGEHVM